MDSPDLLSDLPLPGPLLPLPTLTNETYTDSDSSKKQTELNEPSTSNDGKADTLGLGAKSDKLSTRSKVDELEDETSKSQLDSSMESSGSHSPSNPPENEMQLLKELSKSRREVEEEEREKMQVLVSNFTEDQLDRYEMYRRAAFPKAAIKRIMQTITGNSVSQNVVIAMSGIAKVFVGELVEEALDVMDKTGESGPVQPKHLREAVRKLRQRGMIPNSNKRRFTPYPL